LIEQNGKQNEKKIEVYKTFHFAKISKVSFKFIKDVIELLKESIHRTSLKKTSYETFKKDYSELCHSIKLVKRTLGN
jgi:hypothetical protein